VRRGSPKFGRWVGVSLNAERFPAGLVPAGCAPRICGIADLKGRYKCTDVYDPASEIGIAWDDPRSDLVTIGEPLLSAVAMRRHPTLARS